MKCGLVLLAGLSFAETLQYRTYVVPQPGETLAGRCIYQMTLPHAERPVRGVFVIFERGWQVGNVYFDPSVLRFAARHRLGLLLAQHCPAKGSNDMDVVPEHGIGRALLAALAQLGTESGHPELSRTPLIYFGFSGAGSLAARLVNYRPERTIAAIEYAPGQGDPVGMDTVALRDKALAVPQLVIANGADTHVGTARPYAYFEQYRKRGAPITFLIQNGTPHCCVANILPLALQWLEDVVRLRGPLRGWVGVLDVQDSGVKEEQWHAKLWNVVAAEFEPAARAAHDGVEIPRAPTDAQLPSAGRLWPCWLPSRHFAETWLAFARQKAHPITRLE